MVGYFWFLCRARQGEEISHADASADDDCEFCAYCVGDVGAVGRESADCWQNGTVAGWHFGHTETVFEFAGR